MKKVYYFNQAVSNFLKVISFFCFIITLNFFVFFFNLFYLVSKIFLIKNVLIRILNRLIRLPRNDLKILNFIFLLFLNLHLKTFQFFLSTLSELTLISISPKLPIVGSFFSEPKSIYLNVLDYIRYKSQKRHCA